MPACRIISPITQTTIHIVGKRPARRRSPEQASQKPGVTFRDQIVDGAPGHGEGHNSGTPLNIVAALAVKRVMEREKLSGTLMIWPGVAEELLGTKAVSYTHLTLPTKRIV